MWKRIRKGLLEAALLAVVAGIILGAGWAIARVYDARKAYTPTNLIRLHIIGNSDSEADQDVKLSVRDSLIKMVGQRLAAAENARQAEKLIKKLLPQIETTAKTQVVKAGMNYDATAGLKTVCFPDKYYEDASGRSYFLPQGPYKSLQIVLGEGKGCNWWCVMYPPLCFVDIVLENQDLRQSDKGFAIVIDAGQTAVIDEGRSPETPIEFRFLLLDIFEKGKEALTAIFAPRTVKPHASP